MVILSLSIIILTLSILNDTHVKVYYTKYGGNIHLVDEYDIKLSLWTVLLIIFLGIVPGLNIFLFNLFLITYVIHVIWNPINRWGDYTYKFSLKKEDYITWFISKIANFIKKVLTIKL